MYQELPGVGHSDCADHVYATADLYEWMLMQTSAKGGTDRGNGPVLPDGYAKQAKAVAQRRVVLAGYRLADVLKAATSDPGTK